MHCADLKAFPGKVDTGFPKRKCDKTWNLERFPVPGSTKCMVNLKGKRSRPGARPKYNDRAAADEQMMPRA
jgi:hypothetical protein